MSNNNWKACLVVGNFRVTWYGGNTFNVEDEEGNGVHAWTCYKDDRQTPWTAPEAVAEMKEWAHEQGEVWDYACMR